MVNVKNTMTTTSLTMVTPRITSTSGPLVCISSMTPTVRSGDELAHQIPRSRPTATTPDIGSSTRNGTKGRMSTTSAVMPIQTMTVTERVA